VDGKGQGKRINSTGPQRGRRDRQAWCQGVSRVGHKSAYGQHGPTKK